MKHLFFAILLSFVANVAAHEVEKVVVIGSGAAGSSAAIFAGQSGLNPLVIMNSDCNAQVALIHNIDNYPGIIDPIDGYDLLNHFRTQAKKFGARFISETVEAIDVTSRPFEIQLTSGDTVYAETLIIASGSTKRWLQLTGEQRLRGKGVVSATFCKNTNYEEKNVIIIGGGHAALQEAIYISDVANSITIVNRGDKFSASKYHQDQAFNSDKIQIVYNTEILEVEDISLDRVTGVLLRDSLTQKEYHVSADIVIVAIGSEPNSKLFNNQLEMTSSGNIVIKGNNTTTSVPGVFAAGDVTNTSYGRVVIAAGTGAMAAMDAARYLDSMKQ